MMKIKHLLCSAMILLSFSAAAQNTNEGIHFIEGQPLDNILQQAKNEGKKVFVDCYTSWCGPCKMMATKEFPKKEVGDFMNPNYISTKIDMEKGEGPRLAQRYGVKVYPTFLVLNDKGEMVDRLVGYMPAEQFIATMKKSGEAGSFSSLKMRYEKGERSIPFITEYLKKLTEAYMPEEARKVASDFLKGKEQAILTDTTLCQLFTTYLLEPSDVTFQHIYKNLKPYEKKYGADFTHKVVSTWSLYPLNFIFRSKIDIDRMNSYSEMMKRFGLKDADKISRMYAPLVDCGKGDYRSALQSIQKCFASKEMDEQIAMTEIYYMLRHKESFKDDATLMNDLKSFLQSHYDMLSASKDEHQQRNARIYKQFLRDIGK